MSANTDDAERLRELVNRSNTDRLRQAAEIRARGRAHYVWRYAIVRLALPIALVAIAILVVTGRQPPLLGEGIPRVVGWAAVLFPLSVAVGVVWGLWMWRLYERHWFRLVEASQAASPPAT